MKRRFTQQVGKFLRGPTAESSNWGLHLIVPLVKRLTMKDKRLPNQESYLSH